MRVKRMRPRVVAGRTHGRKRAIACIRGHARAPLRTRSLARSERTSGGRARARAWTLATVRAREWAVRLVVATPQRTLRVADTTEVFAHAMCRAIVGARAARAIVSSMPSTACTRAILAHPDARATARARASCAVGTFVAWVAHATRIESHDAFASAVAGAVIVAHFSLATVARPAQLALAVPIDTLSMR